MSNINTMHNLKIWDWEIDEKSLDLNSWLHDLSYFEELKLSQDGENLAIIFKNAKGDFKIKTTLDKFWEDIAFDKAWSLNFINNGTLYALVLKNGEWTVGINGNLWSNKFNYVWNAISDYDSGFIVALVKIDNTYAIVSNDHILPHRFSSILQYKVGGRSNNDIVAIVQTENLKSGDLDKFKSKVFTVLFKNKIWPCNFINAWDPEINLEGNIVAISSRLSLEKYTIVVNGIPWKKEYDCTWGPIFHPANNSVAAPVKIKGKWGMALNSEILWKNNFFQLWNSKYSLNGNNLAAIASISYGNWTVVLNGIPWKISFDSAVSDITFSNCGNRLAVLAKKNNYWYLLVDSKVLNTKFDMLWPPIFSSNASHIASKVKIGQKYTYLINDYLYDDFFEMSWDPIFNSRGDKILFRYIKNGFYTRKVLKVNKIK